MEINKALDQIDEIYGHIARTEIYRGYRPFTVALTGALALVACFLQALVVPDNSLLGFVIFWVSIALASFALVAGEIVYDYYCSHSLVFRRTTRRVIGQFLPCIGAGAVVTIFLARFDDSLIALLPGIWAILFSMGIFASRPYLPKTIGWVGLYYFIGGCVLLLLAEDGASLNPWGMGIVFGPGQLLASLVLYRNLERKEEDA